MQSKNLKRVFGGQLGGAVWTKLFDTFASDVSALALMRCFPWKRRGTGAWLDLWPSAQLSPFNGRVQARDGLGRDGVVHGCGDGVIQLGFRQGGLFGPNGDFRVGGDRLRSGSGGSSTSRIALLPSPAGLSSSEIRVRQVGLPDRCNGFGTDGEKLVDDHLFIPDLVES